MNGVALVSVLRPLNVVQLHTKYTKFITFFLFFLARDVIYTSRAYAMMPVRLSVCL